MGLTSAEAMACGIPVILSRIEGVTDVGNIEGKTGLYIKPGDPKELMKAMTTLGEKEGLRRRMGRAGAERARVVYGWETHISKWEELYSGLSNRR